MQEYESSPVFSSPSGYHPNPISLSISSSSSIYYTLNGDEPNAGSNVYTGPINLSTTTVVKAIAINSDLYPAKFLLNMGLFSLIKTTIQCLLFLSLEMVLMIYL